MNKNIKPTQKETDQIWQNQSFRSRAVATLQLTLLMFATNELIFEISAKDLDRPTSHLLTDAAADGGQYGLGGIIYRHNEQPEYTQKLGNVASLPG